MVGQRRGGEDIDILRPEILAAYIKRHATKEVAALCAFIYMSGCRITEIVGGTKLIKNYVKENGKFVLIKNPRNGKMVRKYDDIKRVEVPAIHKDQVYYDKHKEMLYLTNVRSLKWRSKLPKRTIPIYIPSVQEFYNLFYGHYNSVREDAPLFDISREWAHKLIKRELGWFPHALIHQRCSHLVANHGFTEAHLKTYRGWADTAAAKAYTHLGTQDIENQMKK